jgi:hypothetical protein
MDEFGQVSTNLKIVTFLGALASLYRKDFTPLVFAYMYYYLMSHWNAMNTHNMQQETVTMEDIQAELAAQHQREIEAKMGADPRQLEPRRQILPTVKEKQMNARGFVSGFNSSRADDEEMMNARKSGPWERRLSKQY